MQNFIENHFTLLIIISLANAVLVVLASVVYRAIKGKGRVRLPPQDVRFSEKWASGVSHKNLLTRLGGARNCLSVELSHNALIVRPMFPFNLGFLPEVWDLEHHITRNDIKRIKSAETDGPGSVVIEFVSNGEEKLFELVLRKRQDFLRAVGA